MPDGQVPSEQSSDGSAIDVEGVADDPTCVPVRHKMPALKAIRWRDGMTEVPGVRYEEGHPPYVVTEHRVKMVLRPGMWLIIKGDSTHLKPCSDEEFAALYERC